MPKFATSRDVAMTIDVDAGSGPRKIVRFGSATYKGPRPSKDVLQRNIEAGQAALARGLKALVKPGVKLKLKKGVPRYSADPTSPGVLIRNVDGQIDRVMLEDGVFRVVE